LCHMSTATKRKELPTMRYEDLPAGTILVGSSSSRCNNCGAETLVSGVEKHIDVSGYKATKNAGCGIKFTHIFSTYTGEAAARACKEMRPDLEFIPIDLEWLHP
jgi:hypothetical protein